MEGVSSYVVPVTYAVPQDTLHRPLLFLILMKDLTESVTSSIKFFADDCLAYRTIHSTNDAFQL